MIWREYIDRLLGRKMEQRKRHLATIDIQGDALLSLFRGYDGKQLISCRGVPEDARVVGIEALPFSSYGAHLIRLVVESETFPELREDQAPWPCSVEFTVIVPERIVMGGEWQGA